MTSLNAFAWGALILQFAAYFIAPLVIWFLLTRLLKVSWRFVGLGNLTWLIALPFIVVVPLLATTLFGGADPSNRQIVWGVALSFTAGIVEETSRYWRYSRNAVLREKTSEREAIVAGSGHGGMEALVLGIQNSLLPLAMILFMPQTLPPYMSDSNAVASFAIVGGLSRILFIFVHIAFSLLVWRAVSQRKPGLYAVAVILHILLDLLGFVAPVFIPGADVFLALPLLALTAWVVMRIARNTRSEADNKSLVKES